MSSHYPYLVASLPMLHFGMKLPFSLEKFLGDCHALIPEEDYAILAALPDAACCGEEFTPLHPESPSLQPGDEWQVKFGSTGKPQPLGRGVTGFTAHPVIKGYLAYEAGLRNAVLRVRASRQHLDPSRYLRPGGDTGAALEHLALASHRHPSPLEGERMLDAGRWQALEHLSFGHYFDLGVLIIYAYKLIILERWEKICSADKNVLLEGALSAPEATAQAGGQR